MKSLLIMLAVTIVVALAGCGKMDQMEAHFTGYSKICVDGVWYIQFTSGAVPAYTLDGKLQSCK